MTNPVDSLDVAYKICTIIGVSGAAIWSALKFIYRNSSRVVDGYIDRRSAASIDEKLKAIQSEVKRNSGNSLKDLQLKQMDRFSALDEILKIILEKLNAMEVRVVNMEEKQAQIEADLGIANRNRT